MAKPKFRENERVEICKGFYRGNTGTVISYSIFKTFIFTNFSYSVKLDNKSSYVSVHQRDLRSLDRVKEDFNKKLEKIIK